MYIFGQSDLNKAEKKLNTSLPLNHSIIKIPIEVSLPTTSYLISLISFMTNINVLAYLPHLVVYFLPSKVSLEQVKFLPASRVGDS